MSIDPTDESQRMSDIGNRTTGNKTATVFRPRAGETSRVLASLTSGISVKSVVPKALFLPIRLRLSEWQPTQAPFQQVHIVFLRGLEGRLRLPPRLRQPRWPQATAHSHGIARSRRSLLRAVIRRAIIIEGA